MSLLRKDVARAVRLKEFHSRVEQVLTPSDRDYFFYALKEYNTYKSVAKLMLALNSCLDTPEKLDLLPSIRNLIPKHDRRKFDNLAPYNRMAHPPSASSSSNPPPPPPLLQPRSRENSSGGERVRWKEEEDGGGEGGEREQRSKEEEEEESPIVRRKKKKTTTVRTVFLEREKGQSWGFSIRGGRERDVNGIFISVIDPFSLADKSGLTVGDQILEVNKYSFREITHQSAVLILKTHNQLQISVSSGGHIPGQKMERKSLIWVDTSGNPVDEKSAAELNNSMEEDQREGDRLLESSDKHKVILMVENEQPLGFSVRGGREFSLGIFISHVDEGSPAEQSGLKVGDQILGVNGHSFATMLHREAVAVLKAYNTLVLTVRSLGKLPQLVTEQIEESDGATPTSPVQPLLLPHPVLHHQSHNLENHTHQEPPVPHPTTNDHTQQQQQVIQRNSKRWSDWRKSASRRSQSVREFFRPRSLYATPPQHRRHNNNNNTHPSRSHSYRQQLDVAPVHHDRHHHHHHGDLSPSSRLRAGSDGALARRLKPEAAATSSPSPSPQSKSHHERSTAPISPLTVSCGTTTTTTTTPPTTNNQTSTEVNQIRPRNQSTTPNGQRKVERGGGGGDEERPFFRYGVGTQLMLAMVSSSAKALLEDSARRCLDDDEMEALTQRLREYETNGGVKSFAEFLVSLLDTPRKMQLLSDIRSILHPTDVVTFDGIVSPHEIAALQKRASSLLGNKKTPPTRATPPVPAGNSRGLETAKKASRAMSPPRVASEVSPRTRERLNDRDIEEDRGGRDRAENGGKRAQETREEDDGIEGEEERTQQQSLPDEEEGEREEEKEEGEEETEEKDKKKEGEEEEEEELKEVATDIKEEKEDEAEEEEEVEEGEGEKEVEEEEEEEEEVKEENGRREEEELELIIDNPQDNYNLVLYEIQNHGGQGTLRRAEVKDGDVGSPHIGAFGSQSANELITKATEEEPSMLGMQTRESFLEWNEEYDSLERLHDRKSPTKNPVLIEVAKSAPQLGLTITGGVDTPSPGVIITDVKQGGAAGIDGFLQPGFEIVQADGVRIRGLSHDAAAQTLARAFRSDSPSIELIVIPN